ncbi:MAG: transglycosylase domain-containing protein, partial [Mycobacterium sp.]
QVPPDDRMTAVLPAAVDDQSPERTDPTDADKSASDSPATGPLDRDAIEEVKAALDSRATRSPSGRLLSIDPAPEEPNSEPDRRSRGRLLDRLLDAAWPPRFSWVWARRTAYLGAVLLVVLPIVTFAMAYFTVDVPKPGNIRTNQVSTILAADGSEIGKIVPPEGNRVDVNINQVPLHVRQAVIAAEDRNFYTNPGFSLSGFGRAVSNDLFGNGDLQGGSTITQQYVKNALVGSAQHGFRGLMRKAKELVIATKMSEQWPKDDVLQAYLNIIYFGRSAYGISAAAKAYFDKPVEQLTVSEGALLAALIRRPSSLDPAVALDDATARWNWVLDGMVATNALAPDERAAQVFPTTVSPDQARSQNKTTGPNGLIQRQVVKELDELLNIDEPTLNTLGLRITTTIDSKAQRAAEGAVAKYLDGQSPDMRAAVVSIDPRTGAVRAYYGGPDANGFDFAQGGLQTGSSFKVFGLVAALEQGIGLGYQIDSSPLTTPDNIKITNVDGEGCGTCSIAQALKQSLNTSYYRLTLKLKGQAQAVADAAHKAGIAASFLGVEHTLSEDGQGGPPAAGIVLGQYPTRVIDMASAYATIADSGMYHKPHFVQKVVNADDQVLFDASGDNADKAGEQRIEKPVADNVAAAMEPIAAYSRGHTLAGGRASAAKTGTTQLGETTANKDAWMVGFTPSLSTAVWVGTVRQDEPLVAAGGGMIYGSSLPSDIWKATMDGALEGTPNESFPKPAEVGGFAGLPAAPVQRAPSWGGGPRAPSGGAPNGGPPPPPDPAFTQPSVVLGPGITIPLGPP